MVKGRAYERVFDYFDENRDGKVSPWELKTRIEMLSGGGGGDDDGDVLLLNEVEVAIESLDKDGDGMLDLNDLVGLIEGGSEEDKVKDLKEAFGLYDVDNRGFITPVDLKRMLAKLGESKSIDECKMMINQFDLNGDGVISFEEFRVMML